MTDKIKKQQLTTVRPLNKRNEIKGRKEIRQRGEVVRGVSEHFDGMYMMLLYICLCV